MQVVRVTERSTLASGPTQDAVLGRVSDAVAVELAVERPARQPEELRGRRAPAARSVERTEDLLAFRRLEGEGRAGRRAGGRPGAEQGREVLGQDDRALRGDHRALDDVAQLPHVA